MTKFEDWKKSELFIAGAWLGFFLGLYFCGLFVLVARAFGVFG